MRWIIPLLLCAQVVSASNSDLLKWTESTPSTGNLYVDTVGYSFTVQIHPLRVTRLGIHRGGADLDRDVRIGIWTDSGTLVASGVIPARGGTLESNFRWISLSQSVVLEPFTTYRVASQSDVISYYAATLPFSPLSPNEISSAVSVIGAVRSLSQFTFAFPSQTSSGLLVGPNLTFEVLPYDTTPPVITLNGANPQTIYRGTAFTDLGVTVTDDFDATRTITGSGSVDTSTVGSYTLTYSAQDEVGNVAAPVTRTVNVVLNPTGDEDNDGLNNTEEANLGTNPYLRDTDGDGVNDLREVGDATDPLDPASFDSLNVGLVAYYPFNGNASDESGNGRNGVAVGAAPTSDRFDVPNKSYNFTGSSWIETSEYRLLDGATTATISAWLFLESGQGGQFLSAGDYRGGYDPIHMNLRERNASGTIFADLMSNELAGIGAGGGGANLSEFTTSNWHHVVIVLSREDPRGVFSIYVDGRLALQRVATSEGNTFGRISYDRDMRFLIGAIEGRPFYATPGQFWTGKIDDIRIYGRALTANDVALLNANERYSGSGLEGGATKSPFDPATAANWSAGGTEWTVDTAVTHDGVDSVKAQTTDGQSTYREYTATGPAVVDFWWKVSSEQLYDTFSYSVNGVNQQTISGEVDWTYRTLTLPEGTHTIRWTYTKDGSDAVGQDAGWLDDFAVYPATATLQVRDGSTVLDGEATVDFGSADVESAGFAKSLTFANQGYVPLEINLSLPPDSPFTFAGGATTFPMLLERGQSAAVDIFLSTASAGSKSVELTIAAPDSTAIPPSITLSGYVRGPEIAVATGGLTLLSGEVFDMGLAPKAVDFTVSNDGVVGDLVISEVSATGNFEIVQQPDASIPPNGSASFRVLAKNSVNGVQVGTVSITSNAANIATFVIPVTSKALLANVSGADITSVRSSGQGGAAGWDFAATLLPDGTSGNALKTGATPDSGQSHLQATVAEAGLLTWRWKLSAQEGFDWLACEVSGGPSPTAYQDTTGDAEAFSGNGVLDIVDMEVAENATDLVFTLTVNGDIGLMQGISAEFYVGIANGKSAGTALDNPWFKPISLTSPVGGMTHWLGSWVSSTDSGGGRGALLYSHNGGQWSTSTTAVGLEVTTGTRSVLRYTVSKASLHFEQGDVLYFDVWSGLGYPTTSALDALSNPRPSVSVWGDPYQSSPTTGVSRYPRGGEVASVSTKTAIWREQTVYVPANGIVKWTYRKDGSAAVGEDAGYITDLSFQPFTTPQTTYGNWWASFGRPTPPAPKTPMAMSGLPAIISWVGGFNPDTAPDTGLYRLLNESGQWKFRFPISKTYGGGSVSAEFTSGLTNGWSGAGVRQTLHSQDANTVIIEATPPAGATKGFMRLNVR